MEILNPAAATRCVECGDGKLLKSGAFAKHESFIPSGHLSLNFRTVKQMASLVMQIRPSIYSVYFNMYSPSSGRVNSHFDFQPSKLLTFVLMVLRQRFALISLLRRGYRKTLCFCFYIYLDSYVNSIVSDALFRSIKIFLEMEDRRSL